MTAATDLHPRHLRYLDSARGIAAIMVIVYHYINWTHEHDLAAKLGSIVFNGSDAVSFFFVLSGFVLSYKYIVLNTPLDIRKFYINRFFRLWPAFFVCILINAFNWTRADLSLNTIMDVFFLNKTQFWEEASLIRAHIQYYTPGWTLVIELVLSLFVPFMIVLAQKNTRLVGWLLFAFLIIGGNMGDWYMFHFHFALGVLLSCIYAPVTKPGFKQSWWFKNRHWLLALSVILFSLRHIARIAPLGTTYTYLANYLGIDFFHYSALAAFAFIVFIIYSKTAQRVLEHRLLVFFGKISYGIYLMHWVLVTDIFIYWNDLVAFFPDSRTAFAVIFAAYFFATILLATMLHYTIEIPFIKLGKTLTAKMKPSVLIAKP